MDLDKINVLHAQYTTDRGALPEIKGQASSSVVSKLKIISSGIISVHVAFGK